LLPLAIIKLLRNRDISFHLYLILLFPILIIGIIGFISGMLLNENSLIITTLGTFDYVKHFLVIFVYAGFFTDFNEFKKIFYLLLVIAVFIGISAFVQEFWALYSKYILEKDIAQKGWRLGIYRAYALVSHYNLLGLYCLFILSIYLFISKKINFIILFSLLAGIFTSVSKVAYTGFVLLAGLQSLKGRRWFLVLLLPITILLLSMIHLSDFDLLELGIENETKFQQSKISYREFAQNKAIEVWGDHPIWGVGPGMFGGPIAFKYRSPIYEEYNFLLILEKIHSLDQLWPQVLAEMGIVGTAAFIGLIVSIFRVIFMARQMATSDEIKGLFTGLATFTIIFFIIYTLSGNLNIISVLFPYCALIGMGLGCTTNKNKT
jgi:O-antigen ligase